MKKIEVFSPLDLDKAAKEILEEYPNQRIFAVQGKMGAGKTTFIKSFCSALNILEEPSSPTFSLINVYYSEEFGNIYHFDFYRMETIEEAFDIGYEDYFFSGNYCFIEWPEQIAELLPENFVYLSIEITGNKQRLISYQRTDSIRSKQHI
ncbi:MAG: tRNA (adenosine(37)-N6)-threonylcarbamoyltransferase complex ATPase subunit type 1 TsaE [Bacteroidales bacterium]|nr:tRNA (adenosine(37)-N6)-threonylcarbamoyltransferase complex ATPase subunit type 1 TsaE [Bacteroidales bacterium]